MAVLLDESLTTNGESFEKETRHKDIRCMILSFTSKQSCLWWEVHGAGYFYFQRIIDQEDT